jgi:hypothetical protein
MCWRQVSKSGTHTEQSIAHAHVLLKLNEALGEKRKQAYVAKMCGVSR